MVLVLVPSHYFEQYERTCGVQWLRERVVLQISLDCALVPHQKDV